MDANTALTLPNVTAVWYDRAIDGYRIQFTVPPGTTPPPGQTTEPPSEYTDALSYTAADWPAVVAEEVAADIQTRWVNWLKVVTAPPPPPDSWSDCQTFASSPIMSSASANWTAEQWPAGTVITETDSQAVLPEGVTVAAVLDAHHVQLSGPADADAQGVAVTFALPA